MSSEFIPMGVRLAGFRPRPRKPKNTHQAKPIAPRVQGFEPGTDPRTAKTLRSPPKAMALAKRIRDIQESLTRRAQDYIDIPLGEYLPDLPTFQNPGLVIVQNALPALLGYKPAPGLVAYTDALSARCQGAAAFLDSNETTYMYAGDASKLYEATAQAWSDESKVGGYNIAASAHWEFVRWGDQVFAANRVDAVQELTMGSGPFADLITSTDKPKGAHMAVVRQFLVLGNTDAALDQVRWSAFNDPTDFDEDQATQADSQILASSAGGGGRVQKIVGREYGLVFQESAIWRMSYVGTPVIWDFDEIEQSLGAFVAGSVTPFARRVFFLAEDGFRETNGLTSRRIGANKIDSTFWNDLDHDNAERIVSVIDPEHSLYMVAYPGEGNSSGTPNKILCYNYNTERWAPIVSLEVDALFQALTAGYDLEGLDAVSGSDIDSMVTSLDSRAWLGGLVKLAAFGTDFKTYTFEETSPLDAMFETGDLQLKPGAAQSRVTSVRPRVSGDSPTITCKVGMRKAINNEAITYSAYKSLNTNGEADFSDQNLDNRYHRFNLKITGGFEDATHISYEAHERGDK